MYTSAGYVLEDHIHTEEWGLLEDGSGLGKYRTISTEFTTLKSLDGLLSVLLEYILRKHVKRSSGLVSSCTGSGVLNPSLNQAIIDRLIQLNALWTRTLSIPSPRPSL